jgi:hypothetical protein
MMRTRNSPEGFVPGDRWRVQNAIPPVVEPNQQAE